LSRHCSSNRRLYRTRKRRLATVSVAAAVLLLAGCSGSSDTATAPPSLTFATDVGGTPGMAGMSSMPGMPAMPAQAPAAGTPVPAPQSPDAVDINNFAFAPLTLTVPVGATVTWTNRDEEPHTVVAGDGSFHSPGMGTGGTYSFTFTNVGSYDYVCSIHPFMHGTVVVRK
jgi:plastocyanin